MDELRLRQTAILPSLICNLKCKLCASAVPYYTGLTPEPIDHLTETLRRYFQVITYVDKLAISGGEPLLYRELPEVLNVLEQYTEQTGSVEIITNGSILPSEDLLVACKRMGNRFRFLIDNYGADLSKKVSEIDDLLTKRGIPHEVRNYTEEGPHCGGWVDFGDMTQKKHHTQRDVESLYEKCAYPQKIGFCFNTVNGIMYPCSPVRRCNELGVISNDLDYIDLFDDTRSVREQRLKIQEIYQRKSLQACAYCNGMCEDSPRFTPAVQLSPEEMKKVNLHKWGGVK